MNLLRRVRYFFFYLWSMKKYVWGCTQYPVLHWHLVPGFDKEEIDWAWWELHRAEIRYRRKMYNHRLQLFPKQKKQIIQDHRRYLATYRGMTHHFIENGGL